MTRNVERADTRACAAETDEDEKSDAAQRLTKFWEEEAAYFYTRFERGMVGMVMADGKLV